MSVSTVYDDVRASVYEPEPDQEEVEIEYVEEEEEEEVKEDDQVVNADEPAPTENGNAAALTEDPYGELAEDPYGGGPELTESAEASIAEEISAGAGVKRKRATQTDEETLDKLRKQIEWYFCDQNLRYDTFFHEKISEDPEGWLDASLILGCARVKQLGITEEADIEAALESSDLELQRVSFETEDGEAAGESLQIRRAEGQALPALQKKEKGNKGKGKDKGGKGEGKGKWQKGGKEGCRWCAMGECWTHGDKGSDKGSGKDKSADKGSGKDKGSDKAPDKVVGQGKAVASFSSGALDRESAAPPAPAAPRQPAPAVPRQPAAAAPRQPAPAAPVALAPAAPAAATAAAAAESEEDKDSRIKQLEAENRMLRAELAKARGQKRELPAASPVAQAQGKKPEAAATPPVAQAPVPSRKPIVKAAAPAAQAQAQAQQPRAVTPAAQQEALLKKRRMQAPAPGNQQIAKAQPAPAQIAKTPPPATAHKAKTPRAAAAQVVQAPPAAAQKIAKAPPVAKAPAPGNQQIAKAPAAPAQKIAKAPAAPAQRIAKAPPAPVKKMIAKARSPAAAQEQRSSSKVLPVVGELALCLVGEYAGQRAKVVAVEDDEYTLAVGGGDFVTLSSAELKKG